MKDNLTFEQFFNQHNIKGYGCDDFRNLSYEELYHLTADAFGVEYYELTAEDQDTAAITHHRIYSSRSAAYRSKSRIENESRHTILCTIETHRLAVDLMRILIEKRKEIISNNESTHGLDF